MTRKDSFLAMNKDREQRGSVLIDTYRHTYEEWSTDVEVLTDILADLMHCCAAQSLSFDGCLEVAQDHFRAEQKGEA